MIFIDRALFAPQASPPNNAYTVFDEIACPV